MNRYQNVTPEGTKDFLFEECRAKHLIESKLSMLFKFRGYNNIITPSIEFLDVFDRESAGILPEMMYKLTDTQGRLITLRPDSTLPIARVVATRLKDMQIPIRLFYSQNVFRKSGNLSGFNDESTQSGIELIGATGLRADLEVIMTAIETLKECGEENYKIEIGHAGFFKALAESLNTTDKEIEQIREYIETKDFMSLDNILSKFENVEVANAIKTLPRMFGTKEVLDKALELSDNEKAKESISYLKELYKRLEEMGFGDKVNIDLGLVHRNNYYTGVVFRGYIEGSGVTVLSGGRYDNLMGEFGKDLPSTGFGVDVDVLANLMLQKRHFPSDTQADILIFGEDGCEIKAIQYISDLSMQGYTCENSVFDSKQESIEYAKKKGISRFLYVTKDNVTEITL